MPSKQNIIVDNNILSDITRYDLSVNISAEGLFEFIDSSIYYKRSQFVQNKNLQKYKEYYKAIISQVE